MPDPMTTPEAARPLEPVPQTPEILKPESYGVYGRLLLATQPGQDLTRVLNPDNTDVSGPININLPRDYNPITHRLSTNERAAAWAHQPDLQAAYQEWRTRFTAEVKTWNTEAQLKALELVSDKSSANFSVDDTDRLYNRLCRGKSDTTEFVRHLVENAPKDADGKINPVYLEMISPHLKWLASKFFGDNTSNIVERMYELEAGINNEHETAVNKIIADPNKIKNLGPEGDILRPIFDSFGQPTPSPEEEIEKARERLSTMTSPSDTASDQEKAEYSAALEDAGIKLGSALYTAPDGNFLVTITGFSRKGPDGRFYVSIRESRNDIPIDEVVYLEKPKEEDVEPAPPAADTGVDATEPVAGGQPSGPEPKAGESETEEELIALYYSEEEGLEGLTDSVIRHVGEHQGEQNVAFKMSISDVLPQFIPLVLRDLLENPEKPGVVDFVGIDEKKPIIRDVQIKDGDRLRFAIKNSGDRKGIELEREEGEMSDDVKEALTHLTPLMLYSFNTPLQKVYPLWEVERIYLEGEGEKMYLRMEFTPVESVPVAQPLPEKDTPPTAPDGSLI